MTHVFSKTTGPERAVRWIFILCFILTISSYLCLIEIWSLEREYRFEAAAMLICLYQLADADILLVQCHPQKVDTCLNI